LWPGIFCGVKGRCAGSGRKATRDGPAITETVAEWAKTGQEKGPFLVPVGAADKERAR